FLTARIECSSVSLLQGDSDFRAHAVEELPVRHASPRRLICLADGADELGSLFSPTTKDVEEEWDDLGLLGFRRQLILLSLVCVSFLLAFLQVAIIFRQQRIANGDIKEVENCLDPARDVWPFTLPVDAMSELGPGRCVDATQPLGQNSYQFPPLHCHLHRTSRPSGFWVLLERAPKQPLQCEFLFYPPSGSNHGG